MFETADKSFQVLCNGKERWKKAAGFERAGGFLVVRDVQASLTAAVKRSLDAPDGVTAGPRSTLAGCSRARARPPWSCLFFLLF